MDDLSLIFMLSRLAPFIADENCAGFNPAIRCPERDVILLACGGAIP
jgi:hypothetical protein